MGDCQRSRIKLKYETLKVNLSLKSRIAQKIVLVYIMSSSTFSKSGSNHFSSNSPKVTGRSWEELRKEARHLENEIDGRLIELSKLGTSLRTSPASSTTPFHAGDPSKVPLLSDEDSS